MRTSKPNWEVCFSGNFWGHDEDDAPGTELAVSRSFYWNGKCWLVPAVYICQQGIVVDLCLRASAEEIASFIDKWDLLHEEKHHYTAEEWMNMEREHPLHIAVNSQLSFNGTLLRHKHGSGLSWLPTVCLRGQVKESSSARQAVDHYGLDPSYGWAISRSAFAWTDKPKDLHGVLELTLEQEPSKLPGPHFTVTAPGEQFTLTHPATAQEHTLTVHELLPETLDTTHFETEYADFPCRCLGMAYTLSPDLPADQFALHDTLENDPPKPKEGGHSRGGAVGVIMSPRGRKMGDDSIRTAVSALHYEPVEVVEWRTVFYVKTPEALELEFTL
ncbi:MAG: hypothetical protein IJX71_03490 [Oscillospiraceae bacterium]|nr:hypothetical protein [Oscillospiraceae bacterium]